MSILRFTERVEAGHPSTTLTLALGERLKGRLRVTLDDGRSAGLFLDRGPILRGGDRLKAESGEIILIQAAPELVSVARCEDPLLFARACYHLGNRHTPLQILNSELRYQHDHVLDAMLAGLGLNTTTETLPFEPEQGAYGEHGTEHAPGHGHGHGHGHHHHDGGHDHGHDSTA